MSTPGCSSQQAAAAWAWFEHGGSTCITPSKAEGLMAAKRNAKCNFAGPSRFKKELLSITAIPDRHSAARSDRYHDAINAKGHARRRHSFHVDDLDKRTSYNIWRPFNSSCTSDQNHAAEDDEAGACQFDDQNSSLLDKFEVDAVCRQLHDHLSSSGSSTSCSTPAKFTCSAELQEYYEAQKAHNDRHPQAHITPRRYFKSIDGHKPLPDNEHHQSINDMLHWLLRLRRIKTSTSSRSTSTAPALCSSIATADSLVDRRHRHRHHHHPASPEQFRAVSPINQTSKQQQTLHHRSNRQNTGRVTNHLLETADEGSGAAGQHEIRGEFLSSPSKSQQKMQAPSRTDLELIGLGAPPSRQHHSNFIYCKVLQPVMSLLHAAPLTDDDGVVCTNRHRHFHKYHHIHHHHHHYHHLQQSHQPSQDAVLLEHLITKNDGAHHVLHRPKLYSSRYEEELMKPLAGLYNRAGYYYPQPRPRRSGGFLRGCLAALCCCCLVDECCCLCDPSCLLGC